MLFFLGYFLTKTLCNRLRKNNIVIVIILVVVERNRRFLCQVSFHTRDNQHKPRKPERYRVDERRPFVGIQEFVDSGHGDRTTGGANEYRERYDVEGVYQLRTNGEPRAHGRHQGEGDRAEAHAEDSRDGHKDFGGAVGEERPNGAARGCTEKGNRHREPTENSTSNAKHRGKLEQDKTSYVNNCEGSLDAYVYAEDAAETATKGFGGAVGEEWPNGAAHGCTEKGNRHHEPI